METLYLLPEQDKNAIVARLGIDPFEGNIISSITIQLYDDIGISINDACVEEFGQDLTDRYDEYVDPSQLKIYRLVSNEYNTDYIKNMVDFTILGLIKTTPYYDRGRKRSAEYLCPVHKDVVVRKTFFDNYNEDGDLELEILFEWLNEDDTVTVNKTSIVETFSKAKAKTLLRKRRHRAIDFLESEAENIELVDAYDYLTDLFYEEIEKWKSKNSTDFRDIVLNTQDVTAQNYLNTYVPLTSLPHLQTKLVNSILFQIGELTEAEFMATTIEI